MLNVSAFVAIIIYYFNFEIATQQKEIVNMAKAEV